ncbi:MAG: hypothetical protein ACYC8T_11755 [Myxococcaceae bacterium]
MIGRASLKAAILASFAVALLAPAQAHAGMPFYTLTDLVSLRLKTLSFFLLVMALTPLGVRFFWNLMRRDFPRLPKLTYRAALAMVTLSGLVFYLVLTMIAGARELMTPDAWDKQGALHTVKVSRLAPVREQLAFARQAQLDRLRVALFKYAAEHQQFPRHDFVPEIPEETWRVADPSGVRFIYVGKGAPDASDLPLAYEPPIYGKQRFVLLTNGEIVQLDIKDIQSRLSRGAR